MQQDQPSRVGRRLAAIVAADVAGYSRLMGLDEVGTARTLGEHRVVVDALVAKYGGRLVKSTGDGVLLEFPSVVDAVECAVAVQEVMAQRNEGVPEDRRMLLRIGINLGDILIEGEDILGDGVNIAARLEGIAEPGGICISSSAYEQVRGKIAVEFTDLGEQSLKNIGRPVRAYAAVRGRAPDDGGAMLSIGVNLPLPDKPSIAVLPFQNMSGDPEQEYFADGMVEDIITALSRFKSLFVIARNSSFTYKGKSIDIKQVGRELGVQYVLEGSVRKSGEKVRITAQLIDAATGAHLWADRFDGSLNDVFDMQDSVSTSVVGAIAPRLDQASLEKINKKRVGSWGAYDFYLRGMKLWWEAQVEGNPKITGEALKMFRQSVQLDPSFGRACARIGSCIQSLRDVHGQPISEDEHSEALRMAEQAVRLAADDEVASVIAAYIVGFLGDDYERAIQLANRALVLNPNLSHAWNAHGLLSIVLGEHERALGDFAKAIRLNPMDTVAVQLSLFGTAAACNLLARYDDGETSARKLIALVPNDIRGWFMLIANLAGAGKNAEAADAISRFKKLYPHMRASFMRRAYRVRRPVDMAIVDRIIDAMGLPD